MKIFKAFRWIGRQVARVFVGCGLLSLYMMSIILLPKWAGITLELLAILGIIWMIGYFVIMSPKNIN